jgi:Putative zinc-finger
MTGKVEPSMPHVDEGTLHALLDGELEPAAVQQVQTHFATCPACQSRLDEARQMMEETERLLRALEPQSAPASGPRTGTPRAEPPGVAPPPPTFDEQVRAALDPVVLIPDNPLASEVRRRRIRTAAWAAGLLIVFGAGGFAVKSGMLSDKPVGELHVRPEEFQVATPSPQEVRGAPAPATPAAATGLSAAAPAPAAPAPAAATPAPQPPATSGAADSNKQAASPAPSGAPPAASSAPMPTPTPPQVAAARAPASDSDVTTEGASAAPEQETTQRAKAAAREPQPQETRPRSSSQDADNAMRALDRQKAADASTRALAAIDAERRARQQRQAELNRAADSARRDSARRDSVRRDSVAAANALARAEPPPPPPQPPTLEQRAQITSRIGLDEASRLLGGPLHAIDAADYTRQFVGIVSGASVPGADPTRPVVRAVYVDRSGRVLYLDQQRVRPGQAQDLPTTAPEGSSDHRWVVGGTLLRLHGERSPAALDSLARRVR